MSNIDMHAHHAIHEGMLEGRDSYDQMAIGAMSGERLRELITELLAKKSRGWRSPGPAEQDRLAGELLRNAVSKLFFPRSHDAPVPGPRRSGPMGKPHYSAVFRRVKSTIGIRDRFS